MSFAHTDITYNSVGVGDNVINPIFLDLRGFVLQQMLPRSGTNHDLIDELPANDYDIWKRHEQCDVAVTF